MDEKIKEIVFNNKCKRRTSKIIIPSEETPINGLDSEQLVQINQSEEGLKFPVSPNCDP